jgi:hypothetical protein
MAIDTKWEKFQGGPTPLPGTELRATICRIGRIHINHRAFREMGKPEAVHLFFNREEAQIGLQTTSGRLPLAFPVIPSHKSTGYRINAAPFCQHFGIKISDTHRFIRPEVRDGKLILKLNDTVLVSRKRRKKKI